MVKLGFIVEGNTEKIVLESPDFRNFLSELSIDYIPEIIDADGNGNLLPWNIEKHSAVLKEKGATHIIILTDLDKDICITKTKNRIAPLEDHICVICRKTLEAWFLSDTETLKLFIGNDFSEYENPEEVNDPYEEIRKIRIEKKGRGFADKSILANQMIQNGFSIRKAAQHPACSSAAYFINKLKTLSQQN